MLELLLFSLVLATMYRTSKTWQTVIYQRLRFEVVCASGSQDGPEDVEPPPNVSEWNLKQSKQTNKQEVYSQLYNQTVELSVEQDAGRNRQEQGGGGTGGGTEVGEEGDEDEGLQNQTPEAI